MEKNPKNLNNIKKNIKDNEYLTNIKKKSYFACVITKNSYSLCCHNLKIISFKNKTNCLRELVRQMIVRYVKLKTYSYFMHN